MRHLSLLVVGETGTEYRRVRHLSLLVVGETGTDVSVCGTSLTACSRRDWYRRVGHISLLVVGETGTDVWDISHCL